MRALVLLAVALCMAGCGGVGGLVGLSFFNGHWVGTWDGAVDNGTATFDVDVTGDITGTMHSVGANLDGPVTGAIQNNGNTGITVTFTGQAPQSGDGTMALTNGGTKLQGILTFGSDPVTFVLDGP